MTDTTHQALLTHYATLLETLSASNLEQMLELLAENVEFIDPFNHSTDKAGYRAIMTDMFAHLTDIRFTVSRIDPTPDGGYLIWQFSAYSAITKQIRADGVSHILIDDKGNISQHRDYWDGSRIMDGMPLLGTIVRTVRNRAGSRNS